jgi:hypothetical protein
VLSVVTASDLSLPPKPAESWNTYCETRRKPEKWNPGRTDGATSEAFGNYLMETIELPNLEKKWNGYQA